MDRPTDLGVVLPRLDSNQQPFGQQPQDAPSGTEVHDQPRSIPRGASGGTEVHPFSDTKLTRDLESTTVPLAEALATYAAKTDARRAGQAVDR